jgi:hypothetical protein
MANANDITAKYDPIRVSSGTRTRLVVVHCDCCGNKVEPRAIQDGYALRTRDGYICFSCVQTRETAEYVPLCTTRTRAAVKGHTRQSIAKILAQRARRQKAHERSSQLMSILLAAAATVAMTVGFFFAL